MRIALIHAVAVAMPPIEAAFKRAWPEVERVNILDDGLSVDRARDAELTPAMHSRIGRLGAYARELGADGVLYTCSAFGTAIEAVQRAATWPVLKPNEAMFEAALQAGRRIGLLATFPASVGGMEAEFRALAAARQVQASIESHCVPEAMDVLQAGDGAAHDRLLAEAAPVLARCDAIMLAQFSTARAADAVAAATGRRPLTAPDSAVAALKARLPG